MTHSPNNWPMRPIGDLLTQVRRPVAVEPDATYREIGIRSHCKGIFHKPETTGKQVGEKRVFWVEPDCLVLNIVFAWEQAVAMTSDAEAGMIASHRFPMYRSRNGKLLPEYVWRYFSTPRGKYDLNIASPGGAGRNKTLGHEEFKRLKIPVPPIENQRKAVAILSTTDRTIAGLAKLIAAKRKLKQGLAQQLLTGQRRLPGFGKPWAKTSLSSFGKCIRGVTYKAPDDLQAQDTETTIRLLRAGNIAGAQILTESYRRWIYVLTAGSSINNLTGKDIEGFALPLPTESSEQARIAAVLGAADRELVLLERKLAALRELKRGLMRMALT